MYKVKDPGIIKFMLGDNVKVAKQLGITPSVLSRILNGRQATRYLTAYCITKMYNKEAEVDEYFDRTK